MPKPELQPLAMDQLYPLTVDAIDPRVCEQPDWLPEDVRMERFSVPSLPSTEQASEPLYRLGRAVVQRALRADDEYQPILDHVLKAQKLAAGKYDVESRLLLTFHEIRVRRNRAYAGHVTQLNRYIADLAAAGTDVYASFGSSFQHECHLARLESITVTPVTNKHLGGMDAALRLRDQNDQLGTRPSRANTRRELFITRPVQ